MKKHIGFTLVEMLVVLAVLGTLVGIGFPVMRSIIAKSRQASCLNQLRSLGVGLESYLQDNNRILPTWKMGRASKADDEPVLETMLLSYVENPEAFKCPQDSKLYEKTGSGYFWNPTQNDLPDSKLSFFGIDDRPDKVPLISDKEPWHPGGTNFLYADFSGSSKIRFAAGN